MNDKFRNKNIIKCSICGRVVGTGEVNIEIVCISCFKRRSGLITRVRPIELKGTVDKLQDQQEFSELFDI